MLQSLLEIKGESVPSVQVFLSLAYLGTMVTWWRIGQSIRLALLLRVATNTREVKSEMLAPWTSVPF